MEIIALQAEDMGSSPVASINGKSQKYTSDFFSSKVFK
jgi:hypothetical protein